MTFDIISQHNYVLQEGRNATMVCMFSASTGYLYGSFNPHWIALPDFLQSISMLMMFIGIIEFFSAQVPNSMKGLIIGMGYCSFLLSAIVLYALSVPFHLQLSVWRRGTISCEIWFMIIVVALQVVIFVTLLTLKKFYKKRKREDVLPNEHIFAEEVYSKYLY